MDEGLTIALTKTALRFSTPAMVYDVPKQNLGIHLSPIPAIPQRRVLIAPIRQTRE